MNWVDFILNIAGLLLWLNWRAGKLDPLGNRLPATLVGTLRRAEPLRIQRWNLPLFLALLIFLRAFLYWQIGPALRWAGILDFGVISPAFRSDLFGRILLFSFLSFLLTLGIFYLCLLLLSILKGPKPISGLVRLQLSWIDDLPNGVKLFLPLVVTGIFWWLTSWLLAWLGIIPKPVSEVWRIEESLIIGAQSYLVWKFPIAALLVLHLLNNYIYFGRQPIWNYADVTAQTLLRPLKNIPLRIGKADFTPVVGIAIVFLVSELIGRGLHKLFAQLSH